MPNQLSELPKERDADMFDVIAQPEAARPHVYGEAAKEAADRLKIQPFDYCERS